MLTFLFIYLQLCPLVLITSKVSKNNSSSSSSNKAHEKSPTLNFIVFKPEETSGVPLSEATHYLWSDFSAQLPGLRVYFYPPYVPPHSLAASGDGVSLASSLTKDKWALGLWWSTMAARGFQNSKLFFIWSKVIWSAMQQALTFTISSYVGICFSLDFFCPSLLLSTSCFRLVGWRLAIKMQVQQPSWLPLHLTS